MSEYVRKDVFDAAIREIHVELEHMAEANKKHEEESRKVWKGMEKRLDSGLDSLKEWSDVHSRNNRNMIMALGGAMGIVLGIMSAVIFLEFEQILQVVREEASTSQKVENLYMLLCAKGVIEC